MNNIKVKCCGIKDIEIANHCIAEGASYLGFVFHNNSPRNLTLNKAEEILQNLINPIETVAVLKEPSEEQILSVSQLPFDYLQIHGNISSKQLIRIKNVSKKKLIKAINVKDKDDINNLEKEENDCEFFLFDSEFSGSGSTFEWNILKDIKMNKDFFVSGGINIENIGDAHSRIKTNFWDLSSGLEVKKGVKDKKLITEFLTKIKLLVA